MTRQQRLLELSGEATTRPLTPAEAMELLNLSIQVAAQAPDADAIIGKLGEGLGGPEPLVIPEPSASAARFRTAHAEAVARDAEALRIALRVIGSAIGAIARGTP